MRKALKFQSILPRSAKLMNAVLGTRNKSASRISNHPKEFFVLGSGRNGSTLFGLLLDNHSDLYLPPEQYALPYSILKWHLFRHKSWASMVSIIVKDFRANNANWDFQPEDEKVLVKEISDFPKSTQNIGNLYRHLVLHFAKKLGQEPMAIGDHSPLMTHFPKLMLEQFPEAKFLFLVRDPRDVVLSYTKFKGSKMKTPQERAEKWLNSVQVYSQIKRDHPNRIHALRYEDLVTQTKEVMEKVASFLGVDFQELMCKQKVEGDTMNVENFEHHQNLYKPIFSSSVGKWKKELPKQDLDIITPMVKTSANDWGYDL